VEFDILYGQGISHAGDVIDLATEANIVEKSGAWFSFQGERIGQGRENAKTWLKENPEMAAKLEKAIRANASGVAETMMTGPTADDDV
jgi:recombination protein RecA